MADTPDSSNHGSPLGPRHTETPDDLRHPGGVTVTVVTNSDPIRMCHRMSAGLDSGWLLAEARIIAECIYPVPAIAVGSSSQMVECVLVRTDGQAADPADLPTFFEHVDVVAVRHHRRTPGG